MAHPSERSYARLGNFNCGLQIGFVLNWGQVTINKSRILKTIRHAYWHIQNLRGGRFG